MRRRAAIITTWIAWACAGAVLAAVAGCAAGCDRGSRPAGTYTVRGELKSLQTARHGEVLIHHEAIPSFVGRDGKQAEMVSMSMPFGVTRAVSLDGLAVGDKVQLTFEVYWNATPPSQIVAMEKLPPDTELELSGM